jgi:hypothetical protein
VVLQGEGEVRREALEVRGRGGGHGQRLHPARRPRQRQEVPERGRPHHQRRLHLPGRVGRQKDERRWRKTKTRRRRRMTKRRKYTRMRTRIRIRMTKIKK